MQRNQRQKDALADFCAAPEEKKGKRKGLEFPAGFLNTTTTTAAAAARQEVEEDL